MRCIHFLYIHNNFFPCVLDGVRWVFEVSKSIAACMRAMKHARSDGKAYGGMFPCIRSYHMMAFCVCQPVVQDLAARL